MKKRFWAAFLTVLMMINLLPISAVAEDITGALTPTEVSGPSDGTGNIPNAEKEGHTHTWDEGTVIASTCTEQGFTEYTCTECGETYEDNYTPALEHDWGEWTVRTAPTAVTPGVEERVCVRGCVETREIPAGSQGYEESYEAVAGQQSFKAYWNDNNEDENRTAPEQLLVASSAVLRYEIVSEVGDAVASGTLENAAAVNEALGFLGINLEAGTQLLTVEQASATYTLSTNSDLPVGYSIVRTDYSTGESITNEFKINYTLTLKNPAPDTYVTTLPAQTQGEVTLNDGDEVIFTRLTDWTANIVWYDDNNRSADGGNSTANTPRVSADDLKAVTKVYCYTRGYNAQEGDLMEGDFGYVVADDTIRLTGLPAYDNEGNPLAYYIRQEEVQAANADSVPGNHYAIEYLNVDNFAAKTNGLYDGGTLYETLENSAPFSVSKKWADGKTPEDRPDCEFYIWRITEDYNNSGELAIDPEFCYAIPDCSASYAVPKENTDDYEFIRDTGDEEQANLFPMYDTEGRRYIYFGKERGLTGNYSVVLDNSEANVPDSVKDVFSEGANASYFLNGSTIVNTVGERMAMPLSKDFRALSLQNMLSKEQPITATFLLQKKDENGNWINADADTDRVAATEKDGVIAEKGSDNSFTVTLTDFTAEDMSDSYGGVTVGRYDSDYNMQEYRWVEIGVSVNGVSASYDPDKWVSDNDGSLRYDGEIIVNDGQTSTVLGDAANRTSGPDDTTAILKAVASGSTFTNSLVGEQQIDIRKYFKDENGNDIAADPAQMAGVEAHFAIYRDSEVIDNITMTFDDLVAGKNYWEVLNNYDRYDEDGREYRFKIVETGATGEWSSNENYHVQVVEDPAGSDILLKRMQTVCVNSRQPSDSLGFDVEKQWLDDSDLQTRNPVVVAVYRFRDAEGNLLPAPELIRDNITLSVENNWYQKFGIPAINSAAHHDSAENYVILEKGILVDGKLVDTSYDFGLTSEKLKSIHDAICDGKTYIGITGSTEREGISWDKLCYRYKLFESRAADDTATPTASYVLTNLRIGTQDYEVEKTWKAGGEIRKCSFGLFYGDKKLAEFTLDVVDDTAQLSGIDWKDAACKAAYEKGDIAIKAISAGKDTNGNYKATVKIEGLDKFDDNGAQKEYAIDEIAIYGTDGQRYDVTNGKCTAGDESYAVGISTEVVRADNEKHRAPDKYTVKVTNTRVGAYDLTANKVWRDANKTPRPDVCFTIFRMSTQDAELRDYVTSGDTAHMSAYLAAHTGKEYRISADRYWDTHINRYWWTCTVKDMQQYDSEGYPYVYYAVERIGNIPAGEESDSLYKGYYCNYTADEEGYRPTNPAGKLNTQKVFGVKNDELCAAKGNVFILSDGIHKGPDGKYKDYYSATAVNRPERNRTVTGKKLWKLPKGWSVSSEELPEVQIDLYRTTKEISFKDYNATEAYVAAIKNAAAEGVVSSIVASEALNKYTYTFDKDSNGKLPRYDEWGNTYYYYVLENPQWGNGIDHQNFPESAVVYEDNDFSINNIFTSQPPYAEVGVAKTWELSADVQAKLAEYGLSGISPDDYAPATIMLYGVPTNSAGKEIKNAKFDFGKVKLTPGVTDSDGDGEDDTVYTVDGNRLTATYTFKTFYNSETGSVERLPFYWLSNYPVHYYLKETVSNGYTASYSKEKVAFDTDRHEGGLHIFYNTDRFELTNTYTGIESEKISFSFSKVWNDKYVDNEAYRPVSVTFTIKRSVDGVVDNGFAKTVTLNKADFVGQNTWRGKLDNLLKYAPSGKAYTYFVDSEKVGSDVADTVNENIGNYTLTKKNDDTLTNTIRKDLSISVEAVKKWTVDGTAIGKYTNADNTGFDDLRKMGVLPDSVQFVVQRSNGGAYQYVPASSYQDSTHKLKIGNQAVLGREINLKTATASNFSQLLNAKMKWDNLPKKDADGNVYTYRVIEILNWHDGTTDTMLSGTSQAERGMTSTISGENNVFTLANDLKTAKVRIAKIWNDENGAENTRPNKIEVTVKPVGGAAGKTFTLQATGNAMNKTDANVYYSAYFHIPAGVAMTYGTDGEKYTVTESFTALNGAAYTQTITSDGGNVVTMPDGTYAMRLTNTYSAERKTLSLEATKVWSGDDAWKSVARPGISFKLQYFDRSAKDWADITDMSAFSKDTAQSVTKTVPANGKVTWTNMFKYWHGVTTDGKAEFIRYRVVEVVDTDLSYTTDNKEFAGIADSTASAKATLTNTLQTATVMISKSWTKNGNTADKLSADEVKKLVALNAIPKELTFVIEYQLHDTSTWTTIPNGEVSYTAEQLLTTQDTGKKLPQYDKDGEEIAYRVRETAVKYSNGNSYDVVWTGDSGRIGSISTMPQSITYESPTAAMVNDYQYVSLDITKVWKDEGNRDGLRKDITVTLQRDGANYAVVSTSASQPNSFCTVTKSDDTWAIGWKYLPKYQAGKEPTDTNKSVYTWEETTGADGYDVTYNADGAARREADNNHQPIRGTVVAAKNWNDDSNKFTSRPEAIYLKLQYKVGSGTWQDVGKNTLVDVNGKQLYKDADAKKVYTTSADGWRTATAADGWTLNWENLPVKALSGSTPTTVAYRVIEGIKGADGGITALNSNEKLNGYTVNYSEVSLGDNADEKTSTVTNKLDTTSLTIRKNWDAVSYLTPVSATFLVEYSHGDSGWQSYGNVTVNYDAATSDGVVTVSGLPKVDGDGNAYIYRVSEASATYNVPGNGSISVNASGSFDDSNAWSGNVGIYAATVSGIKNADGSRVFTADNKVVKGSLSVTKVWNDDNDRDGGRRSVVVELYRDGIKFAEKTIGAADDWTAEFTDLPVYQNTASGSTPAKSVYTLKEQGLNAAGEYVGNNGRLYTVDIVDGVSLEQNAAGNYTAQASITNSHAPQRFSVKATKAWNDIKDYGIRPDVQLELRWATDPSAADWTPVAQTDATSAADTGMTVTTSSPVRQTLKNEDQSIDSTWGSVQWDNLPAYVIADVDGAETSVPVYYKAFEVGEIPASYVSTESAATSYANATGDDMIANVQVVNTLDGKMAVTVQKTWLDHDEQYNAHADNITVKLQYVTSDTDTEWKDVPVNGTRVLCADNVVPWSYTWENLRNDYTYRVIEISMAFGETVLETVPVGSDAGEIGGYTYNTEVNVNEGGTMTQCDITNELIVGKIDVTKTWNDSHDRDGIRPELLTFQLFRDDGTEPIAMQRVNVTADGIEECVFENLPVYKEGTRELSHYYVVETGEDGYSISYDATVDSAVSLSDAVSDVTTVTDRTVSVANNHETTLLRVEATKTWDDANDPYGLRPDKVSLKLQYAFSPDSESWADVTAVTEVPDPATEDGTMVFTTSKLIQTLTSADQLKDDANAWGTAAWENLPAYALVQMTDGEDTFYCSVPVYYRVVESESVSKAYDTAVTDAMSYADATGDDMTATGTVVNTLDRCAQLTVIKKWVDGKADAQVVAQLQYRERAGAQWMPVPQNAEVRLSDSNNWTATFTDLRADLEYRCVELGLFSHGKLTEVSDLHEKNGAVCGTVLSFNSVSQTSMTKCVTGDVLYVTDLTNTYVPDHSHDDYDPSESDSGPGTGDMYNGLLYGTGMLTSAAGIVVLIAKRKKREE